jgi:hypothetical protein
MEGVLDGVRTGDHDDLVGTLLHGLHQRTDRVPAVDDLAGRLDVQRLQPRH